MIQLSSCYRQFLDSQEKSKHVDLAVKEKDLAFKKTELAFQRTKLEGVPLSTSLP
jgi:hypothetical protein